jgi:hypothetical protein
MVGGLTDDLYVKMQEDHRHRDRVVAACHTGAFSRIEGYCDSFLAIWPNSTEPSSSEHRTVKMVECAEPDDEPDQTWANNLLLAGFSPLGLAIKTRQPHSLTTMFFPHDGSVPITEDTDRILARYLALLDWLCALASQIGLVGEMRNEQLAAAYDNRRQLSEKQLFKFAFRGDEMLKYVCKLEQRSCQAVVRFMPVAENAFHALRKLC